MSRSHDRKMSFDDCWAKGREGGTEGAVHDGMTILRMFIAGRWRGGRDGKRE